MACTAPRIALENARPACMLPSMIFSRKAISPGLAIHLHQVAVDQAHGFQRMGVGQRPVTGGHKGLDGMHQRVDAGTGRQERFHAGRGFRVDQRYIRHHRLADDGELHAFLLVGNDHELRDVGRGAGGGRDQDQRRAGHANGVHPFELKNAAPVGNHNADGLAAIHRAATTDRDDHVAMILAVDLGALHHFFDTRVGRYSGVQAVFDTQGLQAGLDIRDPTSGDHARVADHQDLARTKGLGVIADIVPGAGTEDDFRGDEFTQLAETLADW